MIFSGSIELPSSPRVSGMVEGEIPEHLALIFTHHTNSNDYQPDENSKRFEE